MKNKKSLTKKLIIVVCLIMLILIGWILNIIMNKKFSSINDNSINNNINNSNEINNNKEREDYKALTAIEFVNYLNKLNFEDFEKFEILYNQIKLIIEQNINEYYSYTYKIFYNENKVYEYDTLINGGKFYLLEDNENYAFGIVNEIGPVGSHSRYLILVFDDDGDILLSEIIIPINSTEIIIDNNKIFYSYQTKMQESYGLERMSEFDENFCEYLNQNYEDDYVVTGTNKYEYINGKINIIEKTEDTIQNYKERNNCN